MEVSTEMCSVLGRRKESGLSLLAFAKRENLSYSKLQYWNRKLRGVEKKKRKVAPAVELTPVRVVSQEVSSDAPSPKVLTVWLANGVSLEIPTGFDAVELERLVGVLSSC